MKRLTIATAALAAGLATFAHQATAESGNFTLGMSPETGKPLNEAVKKELDSVTTASVPAGKAKAAAPRSSYDAIIAKHAAAHGIPSGLAHAVVKIESNYRANARGRAGEIGLMQIKPATARGMGYSGSAKGLYDPETNIRYGMKYLAGAHRLGGGDVCGTILRYNAGHGAKRMNRISAAYCAKVKRHMTGA